MSEAATGSLMRVRAYRFPLDLRARQAVVLERHAGAARWAYNYAVAAKEAAYRRRRLIVDELVTLGFAEADAVVEARRRVAVPSAYAIATRWTAERDIAVDPRQRCTWWRGINRHAFGAGFRQADTAYSNWFDSMTGNRGGRPVGRPRFKKKGRARDSFSIYHHVKKPSIRFETYRRLRIPTIGEIRIHGTAKRLTRAIHRGAAHIQSVTVSRTGDRWWASILVEEHPSVARGSRPTDETGQATATRAQQARGMVGADVGVNVLVALSDRTMIPNPRHANRSRRALLRAQRSLSRSQGPDRRTGRPPSKRWLKKKARVGRLQARVAEQRRGALHQITKHLATTYATTYATVALEDLNIAGMTRSARGTIEKPGVRVAQKAGLNRSLADAAFGELRRQLEYKTTWYGSRVLVVDPAYTSQTCSTCGHIAAESRKTQAEFCCVSCGHTDNADINAAINIKTRAACDTRDPAQPTTRPANQPDTGLEARGPCPTGRLDEAAGRGTGRSEKTAAARVGHLPPVTATRSHAGAR